MGRKVGDSAGGGLAFGNSWDHFVDAVFADHELKESGVPKRTSAQVQQQSDLSTQSSVGLIDYE